MTPEEQSLKQRLKNVRKLLKDKNLKKAQELREKYIKQAQYDTKDFNNRSRS